MLRQNKTLQENTTNPAPALEAFSQTLRALGMDGKAAPAKQVVNQLTPSANCINADTALHLFTTSTQVMGGKGCNVGSWAGLSLSTAAE